MRSAILLCVLSSPALADDYIEFHTPSANIFCGLYVGADMTGVRCDILSMSTRSYNREPADCEFDWGNSFAVDAEGEGYLACVSDSVVDDAGLEIGYGEEVSLGGITCVSEKTGMTCTNQDGHGFKVSKAAQRVF